MKRFIMFGFFLWLWTLLGFGAGCAQMTQEQLDVQVQSMQAWVQAMEDAGLAVTLTAGWNGRIGFDLRSGGVLDTGFSAYGAGQSNPAAMKTRPPAVSEPPDEPPSP